MAQNWLLAARDALAQQFGGTTAFPEVPDYLRKSQGFAAPMTPPVTPTAVPGAIRSAGLTGLSALAPALKPLRSASTGFAPLDQMRGFDTFGAQAQRTAAIGPTPGFDFGTGGIRQAYNRGLDGSDMGGAVAQPSPVGGAAGESGYALLDQHNAEINAAASKYGVPANLLKSMINRESSGDWDSNNYVNGSFRGDQMLPFVGIFRKSADAWGLDFDSMIGNKQAQIDGMAQILAGLSNEYGGYENAAKVYFGGEGALSPGGFTDELGMNSSEYGQKAIDLWRQLDAQAGYTGGYGTGGGGDWATFIPGGQSYEWGEFGVDSNNGYYDYGRSYGLNGRQHTGVDIVGGWNEQYSSPVSGTVTCAGTGVGSGADGGGCAAFGTMDGKGGAGRIEVQLDNGAVLIFGHSQQSFVRPGQRINAGDALGTIGWANSNHVHLEARVRDPSTPSGWRIVDPRTVLGGGGGSSGGGGGFASRNPFRFRG